MKHRKTITSIAAFVLGSILAYLQYDLWTQSPSTYTVLNDHARRRSLEGDDAPAPAPVEEQFTVRHIEGLQLASDGTFSDRLFGMDDAKKELFKGTYEFTTDAFTPSIPLWRFALADYQNRPTVQYLETGPQQGMSVCWMLENVLTATDAHATVIDPFLPAGDSEVASRAAYDKNLETSGNKAKVTTIQGVVHEELRQLPLNHFDIVYVGGAPTTPDVLEQSILSLRNLKDGGLLILDGYHGNPEKPAIERSQFGIEAFVSIYAKHVEVLHNGYQVILRKKKAE